MNIAHFINKMLFRKAHLIFSFLIFGNLIATGQSINKNKVISAKIIDHNTIPYNDTNKQKVKALINRVGDSLICGFVNRTDDTIYLYGTTYNEKFTYSRNTIKGRSKQIVVDLSEKVPHPDTYFSGMKQYQFYVVPPNRSLDFILLISKIKNSLNLKRIQKAVVKFSYYDKFEIYSKDDNVITGWANDKKYVEQNIEVD